MHYDCWRRRISTLMVCYPLVALHHSRDVINRWTKNKHTKMHITYTVHRKKELLYFSHILISHWFTNFLACRCSRKCITKQFKISSLPPSLCIQCWRHFIYSYKRNIVAQKILLCYFRRHNTMYSHSLGVVRQFSAVLLNYNWGRILFKIVNIGTTLLKI